MKPRVFHAAAILPALVLLLAGPTGCVTGATQEAVIQQQNEQLLQQHLDQMRARIESLMANQEQLQAQIQQLRAQPAGATLADVQAMQGRLADLERRLGSLDAARAQDRQEIVSTLTKNMSTVMAQSSRPSGGSSARSGSSSGGSRTASGTQKGYEHIVGSGETISAIAAAYKVKTSDIVTANNLKDPGHLKVGQKLFIPAP